MHDIYLSDWLIIIDDNESDNENIYSFIYRIVNS